MLVQLAGGRLGMSAGGRRCRGVPPLRGGFFFEYPQPLGGCLNLRDVCVANGMPV